MKTSSLALIYCLSAGIAFFAAKMMYLNRIVPRWEPVWVDLMAVVALGAAIAVVFVNRRRRYD